MSKYKNNELRKAFIKCWPISRECGLSKWGLMRLLIYYSEDKSTLAMSERIKRVIKKIGANEI